MAYTTRTCVNCGYRSIQPNMAKQKIKYESGTSEAGLSKRAVTGTLLGGNQSAKQVNNWLSGNSKRQYKRTKEVWTCGSTVGCGVKHKSSIGAKFKSFLLQLMWLVVITIAAIYFFL